MLLYILFLRLLQAEILSVRILYEKKVDRVVHKVHNWFAEQLIEEYNKYLRDANIIINLEGMSSLLDYKNTNEELLLSSLSGTNEINEREKILGGMNESVILIASTPQPQDDLTINQDKVCQTKLITFFSKIGNINDDTMTKFISTFRSWLSASLQESVPDIFDEMGVDKMKTLVSNLKNSNFESKLSVCNAESGKKKTSALDSYNGAIEDAKLAKIEELLEEIKKKMSVREKTNKPSEAEEDDREKSPLDNINLPESLPLDKRPRRFFKRKRNKTMSEDSDKENEEPQSNLRKKSKKRKNLISQKKPIRLIRQKVQSDKIDQVPK